MRFLSIILPFTFLSAFCQKSPASSILRTTIQDTSRKVTQIEALRIANGMFSRNYTKLNSDQKKFVDDQLSMLEEKDSVLRLENALLVSSTANILLAGQKPLPLVMALSTAAFRQFPNESLLANNLGAILHRQDSLRQAMTFLLYAKSFRPASPILYTNIGNVLFELGDDLKAAAFFRQALFIGKTFSLAREGLVQCHLKKRNFQAAYDEMLRGVDQVSFSPNSQMTLDIIKYSGQREKQKTKPPIPPRSPGEDSPVPVPVKPLKLPEFPSWSDRHALAASGKSLNKWQDQLNAESKAIDKEREAVTNRKLNQIREIQKLPMREQSAALNRLNNNYRLNKLIYCMSLLELYYDDQFEKKNYRIAKQYDDASKNFEKTMNNFYSAYESRHKPLIEKKPMPDMKELQEFYSEMCKKKQVIADDYYARWKAIAAEDHRLTMNLLHEYWIYCEQYLNRVYDLNEFRELDISRRQYVLSILRPMPMVYSTYGFMFGFAGLDIAGGLNGKCAEPQDEKEQEEVNLDTNIPEGSPSDCPFKDQKLKIGIGHASIALDCTSIEVEALAFVGGSVKYNFKEKETTIFVGGGVKSEFGVPGAVTWEGSIKAGYYVKFDSKGEVADLGLLYEAGANASVGRAGWGGTVSSTTGIVTGINVEMGREINLRAGRP